MIHTTTMAVCPRISFGVPKNRAAESRRGDWLREVGIEARGEVRRDLVRQRLRAQGEDRDAEARLPELPADLVATQPGELDVEDDEVERAAKRRRPARRTVVLDGDLVPFPGEHRDEQADVQRVVLDEQNAHQAGRPAPSATSWSQRRSRPPSIGFVR